jgi:hypothetical protein
MNFGWKKVMIVERRSATPAKHTMYGEEVDARRNLPAAPLARHASIMNIES